MTDIPPPEDGPLDPAGERSAEPASESAGTGAGDSAGDPAEDVTRDEQAPPPHPISRIGRPDGPVVAPNEPPRLDPDANPSYELPVGPPLAAVACLVLWVFLQFAVQTVAFAIYAIGIKGLELSGDVEAIRAAMLDLFETMPPDEFATFFVLMTVIVWALTLIPVWYLVGFVNGASLRPVELIRSRVVSAALGFRPAQASRAVFWLAPVIGVGTLGIASAVQQLIPGDDGEQIFERMFEDPVALLGLFIMAVLLAPILEELFFRGFLYPAIRDGILGFQLRRRAAVERGSAVVSAIVINSLIFSGIHMMTYGGFKLEFLVPLFVMSLVMAWLRERTGSTWPCVMAHAAFNATSLGVAATEPYWSTL